MLNIRLRSYCCLIISVVALTGCKPKTSSKFSGMPSDRPVIIAAVGDSITWGALAFGAKAASGGYPAILENKLRSAGYNVVVFNKGIPGEKAYQTHARFARAIADADIVLLMIGTNDIIRPAGCPEPDHCRTAEHIAAMLDLAQHAHVAPFIGTVPPAQSRCDRSWANPPIQALNAQIIQIAQQRQIPVAPIHQAIQEQSGAIFSDCLHLTDAGYAIMAEQWYQIVLAQQILVKTGQ
jgi:lysophospholipase L1-like esterase